MKFFRLLLFPALLFVLVSCSPAPEYNQLLSNIMEEIESGNINSAIHLADSLKSISTENIQVFRKADSLVQIAERIFLDFSGTEDQVITQIENKSGSIPVEDKTYWEEKGWLE